MPLIDCLTKGIDGLDAEDANQITNIAGEFIEEGMEPAEAERAAVAEYTATLDESINQVAAKAEQEGAEVKRASVYEQADDENKLYVSHNVTAENIKHADKLGGIPAPSIAIASDKIGFDSFGEISLLGDKDLIDPRASNKNKVFEGDAYSPRYPDVVYRVGAKQWQVFEDRLSNATDVFGTADLYELKEDVERRGPKEMMESIPVMYQYLHEKDKAPKNIYSKRPEVEKNLTSYVKKKYKGSPNLAGVDYLQLGREEEFQELVLGNLKEKYKDIDNDDGLRDSLISDVENDKSKLINLSVDKARSAVYSFKPKSVDRSAMREAMRKKLKKDKGFEEWVQIQAGHIITDEKIVRYNQETGDRKYLPHDLDNVVKEMTRKLRDGEGFNYGIGSVRSTVNQQFKSVSEIQEARDRIVDADTMQKIKDELFDEFHALGENVRPPDFGDGFGWGDVFSEHLKELAQRGPQAVMRDYGYMEIDIEAMQDFMGKLVNLPTEYFEAKITRAVDLSEFHTAIAPRGLDAQTKKILKDAGIDIKYYKKNDPEDRGNAVQRSKVEFFQKEDNKPRGQIEFNGPDGETVIKLFEGKNLSTLLHEAGHFFLETQKRIYKSETALPDEFVEDMNKTLKWLGVETMDDIKTEHHEKFARGFETYLMEGKAPSADLADIFRRFKGWMLRIYKDIRNLKAPLSNEMREVFDRMLATDEQIESMKNAPGMKLDEEILSMLTAAEKKDYVKRMTNEVEAAKEKLLKKSLREISREKNKWYKEELASAKKAIEEKVNEEKRYQAHHYFKNGELIDGSEVNSDVHKLDRKALVDRYGKDIIKQLPTGIVSAGGKVGIDPSVAAELFGYQDGGQMVRDLVGLPNRRKHINQLADQFMKDKHGDILNDGTIEQEAIQQVEAKERADRIAYEANIIARQTGEPPIRKGQFQDRAKQILADKTIDQSIKPNQFYTQEINAAREAGKALGKKDYARAAEYKRKQLLNHYLYKESLELRKQTERALKKFKQISKRPAKGKVRIDEDYRQKALDLLSKYNLGPRLSDKKRAQLTLEALKNWQIEKENSDAAAFIPADEVIAADTKTHYRDLTVSEFQTIIDMVDNIVHQGRQLRTIMLDGKKMDLDERAGGVEESIRSNIKKKPAHYGKKYSFAGRASKLKDSLFMNIVKVRSMVRDMDGYKDLGIVHESIMKDIDAGSIRLLERQKSIGAKLDEMFVKYQGEKLYTLAKQRIFIESLNSEISKEELISVALNLGNEGNRNRLLTSTINGQVVNEIILAEIMTHMTANDFNMVQEIWDYVDSYWPEIAALEKERTGIAPEKVDPSPFAAQSSDGQVIDMRGGYYPLVYDHEQTSHADQPDTADLSKDLALGRFSSAQTSRSHTKSRTSSPSLPLRLDFDVLVRHLNKVAVDLELGLATENGYKLVNHRKVEKAISETLGPDAARHIKLWYKDIASATGLDSSSFEWFLNSMRAGISVAAMGLKFTTSAVQILGLTHSFTRLPPKYMARGLMTAFGSGKSEHINRRYKDVMEKSKIMADRATTFHRDIYDVTRRMEKAGKVKNKAIQIFFMPIVKMQQLVDLPTWIGAYEHGWAQFDNEAQAIEYADSVVIEAQSSGFLKDLSAIERGTISDSTRMNALVKAFTVFYSYFNVKFNLARTSYKRTDFKKPGDVARFASDYLLLFWVEAILVEMLLQREPDWEEEDMDPVLWHLKMTTNNIAGTMPILREVWGGVQGFDAMPGGYRGLGEMSQAIGAGYKAGKAALSPDEDVDWFKTGRAFNDVGGIIFKYPSAQINTFLSAEERRQEGEDVPKLDYLRYPPRE